MQQSARRKRYVFAYKEWETPNHGLAWPHDDLYNNRRITDVCSVDTSQHPHITQTNLPTHPGSTSSFLTFFRFAMSSTVPPWNDMIPTAFAMALAVAGWSPVTMMTLIPALRHLLTASGTAGRGGSIMEIKPQKRSPSNGKFTSSQLNWKPWGKVSEGSNKSANPRTRSPRPPSSS